MKEHDIVVLAIDFGKIKKGTKGTIVNDYGSGGMYEIEFFDNEHNTIGVERIFKDDLTVEETPKLTIEEFCYIRESLYAVRDSNGASEFQAREYMRNEENISKLIDKLREFIK